MNLHRLIDPKHLAQPLEIQYPIKQLDKAHGPVERPAALDIGHRQGHGLNHADRSVQPAAQLPAPRVAEQIKLGAVGITAHGVIDMHLVVDFPEMRLAGGLTTGCADLLKLLVDVATAEVQRIAAGAAQAIRHAPDRPTGPCRGDQAQAPAAAVIGRQYRILQRHGGIKLPQGRQRRINPATLAQAVSQGLLVKADRPLQVTDPHRGQANFTQ